MRKSWTRWWVDRTDGPLLILALLAVAFYLADLHGIWNALGIRGWYSVVVRVVDSVFAIDLILKIRVLGRPYLQGPWFIIDFLSALPALSLFTRLPSVLQSLRFLRISRVFRLLRILRAIRVTRLIQTGASAEEDDGRVAFHRIAGVAVLVYAALFLGLVHWERSESPPGQVVALDGRPLPERFAVEVKTSRGETEAVLLTPDQLFAEADRSELLLVAGSVLTMMLMIVFARYRMSTMWTRQVRELLNLALPAQVADYFLANANAYGHNVRMPATVIFCDIKGFTSSTERLSIEDLKTHLERVLDAVVQAHIRQDLIIDKFIGDAVMSFRGGNLVRGDEREHAYRVVRASLDSVAAVRKLGDPHFTDLKIGGASGESLLIGTFGTSKRLSYTILGDRVNLAARLEGSCNALRVGNLFCERTRALTEGRKDLVWRRVGRVKVQGKKEAVEAFEAFDCGHDLNWLPVFERAQRLYEEQSFAEASGLFEQADRLRSGGDGPSRAGLERCQRALRDGVDDDWQPVIETTK